MPSTASRLLGALTAAAMALTAVAALAAPTGAAPPPASHATTVNPDPIDNTPHVGTSDADRAQRTEAVLDLGSRVIVGGQFATVKKYNVAGNIARSNLFAYDKATGAIDTRFAPQPNGKVTALLRTADGKVLVAGQFSAIGGRSIPYLAKLDPVTGAVDTTFAPRPNGMVYDIHQANGLVYIGGSFTKVGSATRTNFAVLDPTTGAARGADLAFTAAPAGTTRVMRFDITPNGRKLVAIGNFAKVGGQSRPNAVVLDLTASGGATVGSWFTDDYRYKVCGGTWDTITYDVDLSPDGAYFVIVTTGGPKGPPSLCDTATRWETSRTGTATPTWRNYTGGDSLTSVAVTGGAVYVAGHNRWVDNPDGVDSAGPGAVSRPGIAALSPSTGRALSWNPTRDRGLVAPRLVATAEGLYVLSDAHSIGGEWHPRLGYLTLTGTLPPVGPPPTAATPGAPGYPAVTAAGPTTATLAWAAPASSGTSAISGHRITVRADADAHVVATVDVGAGRTATVSGLTPSRLYRFSVTARNASGYGPESGVSDRTVLPFRNIEAFVDRQHRDLLGRAPTATELASWLSKLRGGTATPPALVDSLLDKGLPATAAGVTRLYRAYFLRAPDKKGLDFWVDRSRRGTSLRTISQSFSGSAEFKRLYGSLSNSAFVRLVYRNVLDRNPDTTGLNFWTGQLDKGASRGSVMVGFSESAEYKWKTKTETDVVGAFRYMLGRLPTAAEIRSWEGDPRAAIAGWILAQPAYADRL